MVIVRHGTHQAGIHYFVVENEYLEFSLKHMKKQLRLAENSNPALPHSLFLQHILIPAYITKIH